MKVLVKFLYIAIALLVVACGGGGGSGPAVAPVPTWNISGSTMPGATITLYSPIVPSSWNNVNQTAEVVVGANGTYNIPYVRNGEYEVSPSLPGYTFSPPYIRMKLNGADYPRVNFVATADATPAPVVATPQGTGAGIAAIQPVNGQGVAVNQGGGITFSATLGGVNSVPNSHYSPSAALVAGGKTYTTGSNYVWWSATGGVASLGYAVDSDFVYVVMGTPSYGVGCGIRGPIGSYPSCSSVGISFDHVAGVVTFVSTPISYLLTNTQTGITVSGTLTFEPF